MNGPGRDQIDYPTLHLGQSLSVSKVVELYKHFTPYLEEESGVAIDASEINHVDTAGLQLLCAFVSGMANQQCQVLWGGISDTLKEVVQLLDLEISLGFSDES